MVELKEITKVNFEDILNFIETAYFENIGISDAISRIELTVQ